MFSLVQKEKISSNFVFVFSCIMIAVLLGFICISIYSKSLKVDNNTTSLTTILMVAASSLLIGNLIGFLFGIPRTVQEKTLDDKSEEYPAKKIEYHINTNLEQVSDWLTKMLIGVGLVELGNIMKYISKISTKISLDIGNPNAESIVIASIMYFFILGFFGTYFATRLYIAGALASADVGLQSITTENSVKKSDGNSEPEVNSGGNWVGPR